LGDVGNSCINSYEQKRDVETPLEIKTYIYENPNKLLPNIDKKNHFVESLRFIYLRKGGRNPPLFSNFSTCKNHQVIN
jgi:hypothetical protein